MKNYGPYPYQARSLSNMPGGKPRRKPWTQGDLKVLAVLRRSGEPIESIAATMGRTYYSVQSQIAKGGY